MSHNFLCISSYFKGSDFLRACHERGNKVYLVTSESLRDEPWPTDSLHEIFFMEESKPYTWDLNHLTAGLSHLMRSTKIDRIVALDDFDVEKAAHLREIFRIPGMGQTTHRYFRDKLAMRFKAQDENIPVPPFTAIFNNDQLSQFISTVDGPWVLKPRSEASATGIQKLSTSQEVWAAVETLGDKRHGYLLEQFRPGHVFHVDALSVDGKQVFTSASKYLRPPMQVAHDGGVFCTVTLDESDTDYQDLRRLNNELLGSFGLLHGASHTEYIKMPDGSWVFLETSSRVGGAYIADKIDFARGVNLWKEWAKIEHAVVNNIAYSLPEILPYHGGLLVSLTKEKRPDLTWVDEEKVRILPMDFHIALTFRDESSKEVLKTLEDHARHVAEKLMNILPPTDQPTN